MKELSITLTKEQREFLSSIAVVQTYNDEYKVTRERFVLKGILVEDEDNTSDEKTYKFYQGIEDYFLHK